MSKLIPVEQFQTVLVHTPLISIDLIAMYQGKVLFYDDSIFDGISTHYVNHQYLLKLDNILTLIYVNSFSVLQSPSTFLSHFSKFMMIGIFIFGVYIIFPKRIKVLK